MDSSPGIDIRWFYSLGKDTQQLQSAKINSAVLYNLHYHQKQCCLCLLTLDNIQTFCRNIYTTKNGFIYTKLKKTSTPLVKYELNLGSFPQFLLSERNRRTAFSLRLGVHLCAAILFRQISVCQRHMLNTAEWKAQIGLKYKTQIYGPFDLCEH